MEEKEIVVGKASKKVQISILIIGIALLIVFLALYLFNDGGIRTGKYIGEHCYKPSFVDMMINNWWSLKALIALDAGLVFTIVGLIRFAALAKMAIIVTNKRVYGTAAWGKRVDLPFDSISAVALSAFKGIAVSSSSGTIKFKAIENNTEVHKVISDLLIERQGKEKAETSIKQEIQQSSADELAKFKDLLDKGVISQEEFDAKKKQLLGL